MNRAKAADTKRCREEAGAAAAAAKTAAKKAAKAAGSTPKTSPKKLTKAFGLAASCAGLCKRGGIADADSPAKADTPQGGNST